MSTRFLQRSLLNAVCASLIKEPNFSSGDSRSKTIVDLVNQLAKTTPEFILKLALYLRDDLNIRTTANFLLALASVHTECRPYLKLYVPATVRLPSDWIEVNSSSEIRALDVVPSTENYAIRTSQIVIMSRIMLPGCETCEENTWKRYCRTSKCFEERT